jgi:hypothetical protein
MVMVTLQIKVDVTEDREVKIKLPDDFPVGEAEVTIAVESPGSVTLGDILASGLVGSGSDWDIGDSEEWIQEQRRKTWEERRNSWTDS